MKTDVNLAVFLDGSGNDAADKKRWTNVARLWDACRGIDEDEQLTFYRKGVGTRSGELLRGNYLGRYVRDRIEEAKVWIDEAARRVERTGAQPRIFIFGFSRGAYAARVLANELVRDVWFVGVWDTVKATPTGPDVDEVGQNVKRIYHAMALDEHRKLFEVVRCKYTARATEVWFPGCHADVGGGYEENDLALVSLGWMTGIAADYGLRVDWEKIPDAPSMKKMPVMHDETNKLAWKIVGMLTGDEREGRIVQPGDYVHESTLELERTGEYWHRLPNDFRIV